MALAVKPILSAEALAGMGRAVSTSYKASIKVYTLSDRVYVIETDTWTETETVHYSGPARVQPIRSAVKVDNPANPTSVQNVQFTVPLASLTGDIRVEQEVEVTSCANNPDLLDYVFVVSEVIDSSNPIERTFTCTADQESLRG